MLFALIWDKFLASFLGKASVLLLFQDAAILSRLEGMTYFCKISGDFSKNWFSLGNLYEML